MIQFDMVMMMMVMMVMVMVVVAGATVEEWLEMDCSTGFHGTLLVELHPIARSFFLCPMRLLCILYSVCAVACSDCCCLRGGTTDTSKNHSTVQKV